MEREGSRLECGEKADEISLDRRVKQKTAKINQRFLKERIFVLQ
jgi:hypothetical protein